MNVNVNEKDPDASNTITGIIKTLKIRLGPLQALTIGLLVTLLLISVFVHDVPSQAVPDNSLFQDVIVALLVIFVLGLMLSEDSYQKKTDIFLILGIMLLAWEVLIGKFGLLDPFLFPAPGKVFAVYAKDYVVMYHGLISSFAILLSGYFLALVVAVPLALVIGWRKRAFDVVYPIAKAVSPIPPTVYLPYAIVLLPTFSSASVFVIFIGAFWPIFVGTVHGVFNLDQRLINSAKTLGLKEHVMLRRVVLPAALPSIFSGATIALILSFITLTVAEMIAATSGLGWYIEYQHQYANYDKVIAGMILMGASVVVVMWFFDRIQKHCLRWQNAGDNS